MILKSQYRLNQQLDPKCQTRTHICIKYMQLYWVKVHFYKYTFWQQQKTKQLVLNFIEFFINICKFFYEYINKINFVNICVRIFTQRCGMLSKFTFYINITYHTTLVRLHKTHCKAQSKADMRTRGIITLCWYACAVLNSKTWMWPLLFTITTQNHSRNKIYSK